MCYFTLQTVQGTGPDGQIRAGDVENFVQTPLAAAPAQTPVAAQPIGMPAAASPVAPPAPMAAPGAPYMDIPLSNMRKVWVCVIGNRQYNIGLDWLHSFRFLGRESTCF